MATGAGLARRPLAAPLGFALLGHSGAGLDRDFARSPLTRFAPADEPPGRRLGVSISLSPGSFNTGGEPPGLMERPFQGFGPSAVRGIQERSRPGYGFTSHRAVRYRRRSDDLWAAGVPYRSCRDRPRCRAIRDLNVAMGI